jgi:HEAT repeat protein
MGTPARELLNDVIPLVRDGSTWELRKEAIPVMVSLASNEKGPGDAKAIAALRKSIDRDIEKSYVVRALAVQGLGVLGKDTVLVDLKKAMNDPAKEVRLAAVQAMAVGPKEKALLPLKDALADKAKEVRVAAVQCYGFAGQASAMPELRNLLDHTEKEMRLQTLNTIVNLKQHVYPKLQPKDLTLKKLEQRAMEETDPIVYIWVHATIMTVTDNIDKKHISPVLQKLKHKDAQVRVEALKVIAMCQDKARPFAYQAVLDAIDDKELNVAGPAIETLVHMRAYDAIPRLKLLMEDKKAPEALKEVAENAVDNLELLKGREKKDKSDKKTP